MLKTNKPCLTKHCLTGLEKKVIKIYRLGFKVRFKRKGGKAVPTLWKAHRDLCLADLYRVMKKIWAYQRAGLECEFDWVNVNDLHL